MFQLIVGVFLGISLLSFIGRTSFLGIECHYINAPSMGLLPGMTCVPSFFVYTLYAVSAALVLWGVLRLNRKKEKPGET